MPSLRFRIVNVFTRQNQRLSGNPLCVFEDGRGVDDVTMQALARQFNLSETTFILPSERATARIRIFTPSHEMPFAGHPTLGSAHVVRTLFGSRGDAASPVGTTARSNSALALETGVGVIPVSVAGARFTLTANAPSWRSVQGQRAELALALGLTAEDLTEPLWVNAGKEQLIVPLTSEEAVRRAKPTFDGLTRFPSCENHHGVYVFCEQGPDRVLARFFFITGNAVLEDPATGSATANLGGYMLARQCALPVDVRIAQGEQAGRPSELFLSVTEAGQIRVAGDVIELGSGVIEL